MERAFFCTFKKKVNLKTFLQKNLLRLKVFVRDYLGKKNKI